MGRTSFARWTWCRRACKTAAWRCWAHDRPARAPHAPAGAGPLPADPRGGADAREGACRWTPGHGAEACARALGRHRRAPARGTPRGPRARRHLLAAGAASGPGTGGAPAENRVLGQGHLGLTVGRRAGVLKLKVDR